VGYCEEHCKRIDGWVRVGLKKHGSRA